jgi:hypothetical protein
MNEREPAVPAPVLILAAARSYSSVVAAMLGSHPQMYGFPELSLFAHDTVGHLLSSSPGLQSVAVRNWRPAPGLERAVAELLIGGQGPAEMDEARRYLAARRAWSGADLLDELLAHVAPLRGVEKSPETTHHTRHMVRALTWYPRARFVHLVRHPVSYTRSLQMHLFLLDRPDVCAQSWLQANRRIEAFCRSVPPDQVLRVRAEEIVSGDVTALARLAVFAGVAADGPSLAAMCHPEGSPYVAAPDAVALGGLDYGFLARPALRPPARPDSLRPPPLWRLPDLLSSEMQQLARSYGYR